MIKKKRLLCTATKDNFIIVKAYVVVILSKDTEHFYESKKHTQKY